MKRSPMIALLVCAAACTANAAESKSTYTDGTYKFSLEAPRFPKPAPGGSTVPVMVFAPAEGGFSCNVNVTIQERAVTRKAYREQSLAEFGQIGFTLVAEKELKVGDHDAMLIEYEGTMQGKQLKWLSLAVFTPGRVYLVTCTATKAAFAKHEKEFRACLASFKLEK